MCGWATDGQRSGPEDFTSGFFDLAQKTAKYVESGEGMLAGHTEGRGEVAIGVTDARRCQADSGCLPGFRCSERICVAK